MQQARQKWMMRTGSIRAWIYVGAAVVIGAAWLLHKI